MSWTMEGRYFENCSCDVPCPCTVSFSLGADRDRCEALLAFHVDRGEIEGVDVADRTVAVLADTPKVMTDGDWRLGLVIDDGASDEQADKLAAVFGGQKGGPMEALAPLVGEMLGIERTALRFASSGGTHELTDGAGIDIEVRDVVPFGVESGEPAQVTGVFHPAGSTLTIARAERSRIDVLGLRFDDNEGRSAFSAPFSWSA